MPAAESLPMNELTQGEHRNGPVGERCYVDVVRVPTASSNQCCSPQGEASSVGGRGGERGRAARLFFFFFFPLRREGSMLHGGSDDCRMKRGMPVFVVFFFFGVGKLDSNKWTMLAARETNATQRWLLGFCAVLRVLATVATRLI